MKFSLDTVEAANLVVWNAKHYRVCPFYDDGTNPNSPAGAIGGTLTYCFTPTSIGCCVRVKCACGEEIDLTDYRGW